MFPLANVLQPLIDAFEWVLVALHGLGLGWGMAIVALTVIVRALLLPLSLKSIKSMRNLALLQPEMTRLRAKYKDDPQRLNQEVMKFYRSNKVNPAASCLPLVAQFPVFMALFFMLQDDLRVDICPEKQQGRLDDPVACGSTEASSFLFIPDLTSEATGGVLIVLVVLYVASQLFSMLLSMVQSTADKTQRYVMMALPFVFVPFILNFPAGLLVYWITTNLWTIVQQVIINKTLGPMKPPEKPDEGENVAGLGRLRPAPAAAGTGELVTAPAGPRATPPPPPRRKKKRSGRRR
ncbi:MAG: YidC/Oxa1 family membrane protein insertase [Actinomycetota bacterium]|nr:YidC/Oxa1 family membrane protein insertase [Actinomycetota bacterium]